MDMNSLLIILEKLDIPTLLAMGAMFWMFTSHLDKKFEKIDQRFEKIDQRFEKIDQRFEKIENRLNEIDRRLVAVETTLRIQGACALKEGRALEKAE